MICDQRLPGIDGATVIRRLRLDPDLRTIPCILVTVVEDAHSELMALEAGADAFVRKASGFDLVHARLAALLRQRWLPRLRESVPQVKDTRLLLIDDSPTFRQELGERLTTEGYHVDLASGAEEALEISESQSFDAMVVDLMMPGMDGIGFCRRIKSDTHHDAVPVILLTANEEPGEIVKGLNAGADDFVTKSEDFGVLLGRLQAQLRRRRLEQEHRRNLEERHRRAIADAQARASRKLAETRAELLANLERKNVQLEQARLRAEDSNRFKSEFLANMSHEIRTPMNAILGFTELLMEQEEDPRKSEWLGVVSNSGKLLLNLINDILDISKIEAGKLSLEARPFSLRRLCAGLEKMFHFRATEKDLSFEVALTDAVPPVVSGDPHRINQVLINLLSNAFKYTDLGRVRLQVDHAEGQAQILVEDTGPGILRDKQEQIFHTFEQAEESTSRIHGGTGLGLSITRSLVSLMHGTIQLVSDPGEGASFRLVLPLPVAHHAEENLLPLPSRGSGEFQVLFDVGQQERRSPAGEEEFTILVVEDNPINQIFARALLRKLGLSCDMADNGREAMNLLGRQDYDLVLLDMEMPVMDGWETIRAIRREPRWRRLYVVALTAHAIQGSAERCIQAGCDAFISKPIDHLEFQEMINLRIQIRQAFRRCAP